VTNSSLRSDKSFDSINTRRLAKQLHKIGVALADIGDQEERIVAASADLKYSTLVSEFEERHPDRIFQFGISERNMIGAAAGMASCGLLPYVGTFASFSGLLAYENIRTDLAYPQMPVRILATHSGISMGYFATSHHATEDLSALRSVADLMVLSPADGTSGAELLRQTVHNQLPIYFRLSRGRDESMYEEVPPGYRVGVPHSVRSGSDLLIIATGLMVRNSALAADELAGAGIQGTVVDVHTIKPFAGDAIAELAAKHSAVLIAEEHNVEGGLGTLVQEALGARGLRVPTYKHGLYDEFSIIGPPNHLYEYYGLDPGGVATVARRVMEALPAEAFFGRGTSLRLWTDEDHHRVLREVHERSPKATKAAASVSR
jgi:transketolase